MTMATRIYKVDAFTDRPFSGNPAAVCILGAPRNEKWMQAVAREMNLSETAFITRKGKGTFGLRWFTPTTEVKLCGHATLASAHIIYDKGIVPPGIPISFNTLSGELKASKRGEFIELDFPAQPGRQARALPGLEKALGVRPKYVGVNRGLYYLVEVGSERAVRDLDPDMGLLRKISGKGGKSMHGVIVTSRASSKGYDFVSRFFAPAMGIDEDPVTGSAHCYLGPFWKERLGRDSFTAYQASKRGGTVKVTVHEDRVLLGGKAATVLEGELKI